MTEKRGNHEMKAMLFMNALGAKFGHNLPGWLTEEKKPTEERSFSFFCVERYTSAGWS